MALKEHVFLLVLASEPKILAFLRDRMSDDEKHSVASLYVKMAALGLVRPPRLRVTEENQVAISKDTNQASGVRDATADFLGNLVGEAAAPLGEERQATEGEMRGGNVPPQSS